MENERREYDDYGEPRRDRRDYPAPSSNRTVWIVLAVVGCGTALAVGGLFALGALIYWGFQSIKNDMEPAQAVADQFFDRLKAGKTDEAYELTSANFRKNQNATEFADFVKRFETLKQHTTRTQNGFRIFQDPGGKRVSLQMTLNAPNNALTCTLILAQEGGVWKVDKLTVP